MRCSGVEKERLEGWTPTTSARDLGGGKLSRAWLSRITVLCASMRGPSGRSMSTPELPTSAHVSNGATASTSAKSSNVTLWSLLNGSLRSRNVFYVRQNRSTRHTPVHQSHSPRPLTRLDAPSRTSSGRVEVERGQRSCLECVANASTSAILPAPQAVSDT